MTTPNYENHPENFGPYGHPTDYSQFEVNTAAGSAGANALRYHGSQLADGFYGNGSQPHPINNPQANGWAHMKGTGRLQLGKAISWGVKAFGANPTIWLIIGAVVGLLALLSSATPGVILPLSATVATILITPVIASVALQQTLVTQVKSPSAPTYGKTLGILALLGLMAGVVVLILGIIATMIGAATFTTDFDALPADPTILMDDPEFLRSVAATVALIVGIVLLGVLLLAPFITFPLCYAADNNGTFGHALGEGMKAGARNYLPVIGLILLTMIGNLLVSIPAGIGAAGLMPMPIASVLQFILAAVVTPVLMLISVHAYRQVSGGPVPEAAHV